MKYASLVYPAGGAGVALVLLRMAVALPLVTTAVIANSTPVLVSILLWIVAIAAGVGAFTRFAAAAAATLIPALLLASCAPGSLLPGLLSATALGILGPGALSIDALRFGRRTLRISGDQRTTG